MNTFGILAVATFATLVCQSADAVTAVAAGPSPAVIAGTDSAAVADSIFEADPYFLLMGEADDAIAEKNWPVAAARLSDALAVKPDSPANVLVYNNLANVYTYMGYDSLAIETFNRGLEIAPRMTKLLSGRARLELSMGRTDDAFEDFSRVIAIDSLSTNARFYRGLMSLFSGNSIAAEDDFKVLASVAPKSLDTAVALGTLYSMTGRERQAIPYLEILVEHDPAAEYFASLAGCYLELEMLSEASGAISDGLARYPDDPELYYYRAWLNRERFRNDDAQADAKKAVALGANPQKVARLFK